MFDTLVTVFFHFFDTTFKATFTLSDRDDDCDSVIGFHID